jgi:hypothetical protein
MTANTTLTLGDFTFARFEIPERINFGGEQRLNTHRLVGGKRVIDAMGADPAAVSWSGFFVGENALARARYLETLRDQGKPLALTYSAFAYTVIIRSFVGEFLLASRIPYQITCEVVSNDALPVTDLAQPSVQQLVTDDANSAVGLAALIGDSGLTGAVGSVSTALGTITDFTTSSLAQIRALLMPINQARAVATSLLAQSGTALANLGNLASLGGTVPNPVSQFVTGLASSVVSAQVGGPLSAIDATLGRMQQNIGAVTAGVGSINTGSTTLFAVAASEYGDAMQWTKLAQANGLTDPQLTGINTLSIPAANGATSGGVLNA